jgi:hypothetical protein
MTSFATEVTAHALTAELPEVALVPGELVVLVVQPLATPPTNAATRAAHSHHPRMPRERFTSLISAPCAAGNGLPANDADDVPPARAGNRPGMLHSFTRGRSASTSPVRYESALRTGRGARTPGHLSGAADRALGRVAEKLVGGSCALNGDGRDRSFDVHVNRHAARCCSVSPLQATAEELFLCRGITQLGHQLRIYLESRQCPQLGAMSTKRL